MNHTLLPKVVIRAITPFFKGIASFNILQVFRRIQSNPIFSLLLSFIFLFLFNTTSQAQCGNNNVLVSGSLTPLGVGKTKTLTFRTGEYVLAYCEAGASYTISACKSQYYTDAQISVYSDLGGNLLAYNDDYCGLLPQVTFTSPISQYVRVLLDRYYCHDTGDMLMLSMTQNTSGRISSNMLQPENRVFCHNTMTSPILFDSPTRYGQLTYYWTNDNPNIGLPSLGTGNIPAFTPINTGTNPIVAHITVSLRHQYDTIVNEGIPLTFTITVNPTQSASITGLDSSYCQNAPSVQLIGTPAGGYFSTIYGSTLAPSNFSVGKYKIKYINPNACPTESPEQTFEIKPVPVVSIIGLKTLFCKNDTAITLQGFPSGGIFTIDDVTTSVLDPSVLSVGYHIVKYTYTNSSGCTNSTNQTIEVKTANPVSFTGLDSVYCQYGPSVELKGTLAGGYFLVDGYYYFTSIFYPSNYSSGKHSISYINYNACPIFSAAKTFEIKSLTTPSVSISNLKSIICKNESAITLQGFPSGGVFTIDSVTTSVLDPSILSAGNHIVKYLYADPNGCSNFVSQTIEIRQNLPSSFTGLDSFYCKQTSPIQLYPTPSRGHFLLNNNYYDGSILRPFHMNIDKYTLVYVSNEACFEQSHPQTFEVRESPQNVEIFNLNSYSFCSSDTNAIILQGFPVGGRLTIDSIETNVLTPSKLSIGYHTIEYVYTNSVGCSAFISRIIRVGRDTSVSFTGLDSVYCKNSPPITLTGMPSGGYFLLDDSYYINSTFEFYNLSIGKHTITYQNYNTCARKSSPQVFELKETFYNIDILNLNSIYCKNGAAITLSGFPSGGTFTIDDIETSVLDPSVLSASFHIVKYFYTSANGCSYFVSRTIEIKDTNPIFFTGLDSVYCKNTSSVTLVGVPSGGYFTIDGYSIYGSTLYLSGYSIGRHKVEYIRYSDGVCFVKSPPQFFEIKSLDSPPVFITNFKPVVCKNEDAITLAGTPSGGTFTVDNSVTIVFDPSVLSLGNHTIKYSYKNADGCSNSVSQTTQVRAYNPISITGIDSVICYNSPPILLTGTPSGGYFLIDSRYYNNTVFYTSNLGVGQHTIEYVNEYFSCPVQSPPVIFNIITIPLVIVPSDIRANSTTGKCGSNITYSTPIIGNSTQTSYTFSGATAGQGTGNGSGSFFNIGETQVVVSVRNQCGLYSRSFKVIVADTEKPTITCPANQNIILGSFECNRVVSFNDPSVSDGCSVSFRRIDTLTQIQSGSSLSAGIYDFKYRATDNSGNTSDCTFKITVNSQNSTATRLNCIPNMTVSLDSKQCYNSIEPAQLLTDGNYYCSSLYSVSISSRDGDGTTPKNYITNDDLGKTIIATVKNNFSQSCTTSITVVDKQAPVLSVLQDTLVSCAELSNGKVLATLSQPNIIYECSKTAFTYQDKVLIPTTGQTGFTVIPANFPIDKSFDYGMGSQSSKIIIRTYTATDEYNNSSTIQRVIYVKNINLSDVTCPKDMTLQCENGNYNASITVTGTPILVNNGRSLQDISCAIDYFYSDQTSSRSQGYTIKRAWTLIKRGTQERQVCTQTITVVCSNTPLLSISGAINKETGESVSATIRLSNGTTDLSQQEGSAYKFLDLPYSDLYRIRAERDNDVLNGVTTYDISRISKHILGLQPLTSPYQMIAADVNKDGSIDGADIIYIRNVLLKRISRFPNNTSWRFIPKNYKFTDETNPFNDDFPEMLLLSKLSGDETQGDFVAVKVGDVNLSSQSQYHSTVVRSSNIDYIDIDDVQLRRGEELIVKLQLNNKRLSSLQMSLKIDKSGVDLLKVTRGDLPEFESTNMELDWGASLLRSVWHNPSSGVLKEENTIMYITIKAKKDMWLHDILSVDDLNMVNVSYNTEGEEKSLVLRFKAVEMRNPQFELHQNRPNPFSEETRISFVLPEGGVASLEVYDLTGRTVYTVKKAFAKGYNEVIIGANDLPTAGTYFYRLQSDTHSATKKMQVIGH